MPDYVAKYSVSYNVIGDSRCDSPREYTSQQFFSAETIDIAFETARRFRRELKDSFTYSVTLESLEERVLS